MVRDLTAREWPLSWGNRSALPFARPSLVRTYPAAYLGSIMRRLLAVFVAVAALSCSEPYRYEKRGVELVRIHKASGKAEVMRRQVDGTDLWVPVSEASPSAAPPSTFSARIQEILDRQH